MSSNRRLLVLLAILGALALALVGRVVLSGGGGDGTSTATSGATSSTTSAATTTATTSPDEAFGPTEEFTVYRTRNPFEPVVGGVPTPTTVPTTPTTVPPGSTTTTAAPSFEPPPGEAVALLDVFVDVDGTEMARVQMGSTVYTVGEGDVFATSYQVVSLDEPCGEFLFGDSVFTLCEGEQVIK